MKEPCAKYITTPTNRFTVVAEPVAPSDPVYVSLDSLRLAYIDWLRNLPLQRLHEQHVAYQWETACQKVRVDVGATSTDRCTHPSVAIVTDRHLEQLSLLLGRQFY